MGEAGSERVVEALRVFVDALDNAVQVLRRELGRLEGGRGGLSEEAFNALRWEPSKGERLGEFEVAFKAGNPPDGWRHAFNILRANNATIKAHFAPEGFKYYYWLYPEKYDDRIFRKSRAGSGPTREGS